MLTKVCLKASTRDEMWSVLLENSVNTFSENSVFVERIRINSIEIVITRYCKLENLGQIRQVNKVFEISIFCKGLLLRRRQRGELSDIS